MNCAHMQLGSFFNIRRYLFLNRVHLLAKLVTLDQEGLPGFGALWKGASVQMHVPFKFTLHHKPQYSITQCQEQYIHGDLYFNSTCLVIFSHLTTLPSQWALGCLFWEGFPLDPGAWMWGLMLIRPQEP